MAKLIQVGGAGAGSEFDLKPENTVGRTPGVEILVQDPTISRNHASIVQVAGKWVVTDLGSSNGSEINGQRLNQPMPLSHGDQVRFGTVDFKFDALASADLRQAAQPAQPAKAPEPTAPKPVVEQPGSAEPHPPESKPPEAKPAAPKPPAPATPQPPAAQPPAAQPPAAQPPAAQPPAAAPPSQPASDDKDAAKPSEAESPAPPKKAAPAGFSNFGASKKPAPAKKAEGKPSPAEAKTDDPKAGDGQAAQQKPAARAPAEKAGGGGSDDKEEPKGPKRIPKPEAPKVSEKAAAATAAAEEDEEPPPPIPRGVKRVRTPTVLQMEAVECGAAALSIILQYYGRIVPLEELRVECGVSRDGSKASNVLKAARRYGLTAKGFRHDLATLYELEMPCILFWNFNHFLVLEGFKKGKVYLNDPAQGPRVVDLDELDGSFSGVVMTFEAGDEFEKGGSKPSMRGALERRLKGNEIALLFALLTGLFLVVPGLVVPTFARVFIDNFLIQGRTDIVRPLLLGMGLTAALRMGLTYLQEYYLLRLESKLALVTSSGFFNHIMRLPVTYFSQRFGGEIGSRVAINNKVAMLLSGTLATTLLDCLVIVFYAILMMLYDVSLTFICIGLALINIMVVRGVARLRVDASRRLMQEEGKLTGTAMGGLQMIETLKATGSEPEFFGRWAGYQAKTLKAQQTLGTIGEFVNAVPPLVKTLTTTAILFFGGSKVMSGGLTVGELVAFQTLMMSFTTPLNSFVNFGSQLQELEADMNRLDDVLKYPVDKQYNREGQENPKARGILKLSGHVELRNITFGYSPLEPPLIEDFSLTIKPGQRVALVGGSGSGKSTVAKMITGLYEPWSGDILFDGLSRDELPPSLMNNSVASVDQEVFLFGGTVRENVSMWDSTIPDAAVIRACKDAEISEVIETRDGAYKSMIDEGGGNFSGGQRQRLEIARALVGSPTILVLDEATSALDPTTELKIDENLRQRGCTCIIVAHRLSTIKDADEIIVLQRGKIIQRGTHEEMVQEKMKPYYRLIQE